jgi:hypothetical protein
MVTLKELWEERNFIKYIHVSNLTYEITKLLAEWREQNEVTIR